MRESTLVRVTFSILVISTLGAVLGCGEKNLASRQKVSISGGSATDSSEDSVVSEDVSCGPQGTKSSDGDPNAYECPVSGAYENVEPANEETEARCEDPRSFGMNHSLTKMWVRDPCAGDFIAYNGDQLADDAQSPETEEEPADSSGTEPADNDTSGDANSIPAQDADGTTSDDQDQANGDPEPAQPAGEDGRPPDPPGPSESREVAKLKDLVLASFGTKDSPENIAAKKRFFKNHGSKEHFKRKMLHFLKTSQHIYVFTAGKASIKETTTVLGSIMKSFTEDFPYLETLARRLPLVIRTDATSLARKNGCLLFGKTIHCPAKVETKKDLFEKSLRKIFLKLVEHEIHRHRALREGFKKIAKHKDASNLKLRREIDLALRKKAKKSCFAKVQCSLKAILRSKQPSRKWPDCAATPFLGNNSCSGPDKEELEQRVRDYIERKVGKKLGNLKEYNIRGFYFFFSDEFSEKERESARDLVDATFKTMEKKLKNPKVWNFYRTFPTLVVKTGGPFEVSGGCRASYTNDVVYCAYAKLMVNKSDFSAVVPHEFGHHLFKRVDGLEDLFEDIYDEHLDRKKIDDDDQASASEYFSNTSEAFFEWSNNDFPVDAGELKKCMPEAHCILERIYEGKDLDGLNLKECSKRKRFDC